MPLTGVTLPFVSYGGSSLLTAYFSLLILLIIGDVARPRQGFTPIRALSLPRRFPAGWFVRGGPYCWMVGRLARTRR
jgi:hypothetical protein